MVMWYWSADSLLRQLSINQTADAQIKDVAMVTVLSYFSRDRLTGSHVPYAPTGVARHDDDYNDNHMF